MPESRYPAGFPDNPLVAALLGWLPWMALLLWLSLADQYSPPGLDTLSLSVVILAAVSLTFVFLCLRLLPWAAGLHDPGLWLPQAVAGCVLMLSVYTLMPQPGRFLMLIAVLPWLACHAPRLGLLRLALVTAFVAVMVLLLPLAAFDWIAPLSMELAVHHALAFLLGGIALLIPLWALDQGMDRERVPAAGRPADIPREPPKLLARNELLEALKREQARCLRRDVPFSVCLLALDELGQLQLQKGEAVFERLNQAFGKCILSRARQLDLVGRLKPADEAIGEYSGCEYVAVLPETALVGSVSFANRIRHAMEQLPIRLKGETLHCTASAGVAEYRKGEELSQLLLRAQHALNRGQRLGSNRVERETAGG